MGARTGNAPLCPGPAKCPLCPPSTPPLQPPPLPAPAPGTFSPQITAPPTLLVRSLLQPLGAPERRWGVPAVHRPPRRSDPHTGGLSPPADPVPKSHFRVASHPSGKKWLQSAGSCKGSACKGWFCPRLQQGVEDVELASGVLFASPVPAGFSGTCPCPDPHHWPWPDPPAASRVSALALR